MLSMFADWKFEIADNPYKMGYKVYIFRVDHEQKIHLLKFDKGEAKVVQVDPKSFDEEFSFAFPGMSLQPLMEKLWSMGLRPSDRKYENEIDLLKAHIADLQKILGISNGRSSGSIKFESEFNKL